MDALRHDEFETKPPDDDVLRSRIQLLLTPEQAATSLAIGRTTVYELMRSGALESVRIGASRRVPVIALEEYVERLREKADISAGMATVLDSEALSGPRS